jgi:Zn-dependent metalloprotease
LQTQTRPDATDPYRAIKRFLDDNAALFSHDSTILNGAQISRDFPTAYNGVRTVVWAQELDGIAIFGATLYGHIARNGELVSLSSQFLPNPARAADAGVPNRAFVQAFPPISAQRAIASASTNIGEQVRADQVEAVEEMPDGPARKQRFRAAALLGETRAELVWLPMDRDTMRLCWRVTLTGRTRGAMFQVLVNAETGEVPVRHSWTFYVQSATFRVFGSDSPSPFSPGWPTPNTTSRQSFP